MKDLHERKVTGRPAATENVRYPKSGDYLI